MDYWGCLLSSCGVNAPPRVRIPASPPARARTSMDRGAVYETDSCEFESHRARLVSPFVLPAGVPMTASHHITPLMWLYAPEWLTIQEACLLSGWDPDVMQQIIEEGGVDLNSEGLIEKRSLYEFQEATALVMNWDD